MEHETVKLLRRIVKDGFQTLLSPDEDFADPQCFTAVFSPEQRNQFFVVAMGIGPLVSFGA